MNYNKDKKRARLNDSTVAGVLHVRDIPPMIDSNLDGFSTNSLTLYIDRAFNHRVNW